MTHRKTRPLRAVSSFSAYFETRATTREVLRSLGCTLELRNLNLPRYTGSVDWARTLVEEIETLQPRLSAVSEIGRREFLIAPFLIRLGLHTDVEIASEYYVDAGAALRGSLDYLVTGKQTLIVIEAKQGDFDRGFRQLAAQMVAVDQQTESEAELLYGAITIGDIWRFAILHRISKAVVQDTALFRVPADLEDLARVMVAILEGEAPR